MTRSLPIRGLRPGDAAVDQVAAVDDARLAAELPGGDHVGVGPAERPGVREARIGRRDRVRRHVELRAGVAVDDQDVAVIRAERPDALLAIDLEPRERRPGARVLGRHQEREVDEPRRGALLGPGRRRQAAGRRHDQEPSRDEAPQRRPRRGENPGHASRPFRVEDRAVRVTKGQGRGDDRRLPSHDTRKRNPRSAAPQPSRGLRSRRRHDDEDRLSALMPILSTTESVRRDEQILLTLIRRRRLTPFVLGGPLEALFSLGGVLGKLHSDLSRDDGVADRGRVKNIDFLRARW